MPDLNSLQTMSQIDIGAIDKSELRDIMDVVNDPSMPAHERILHYLEQIKNPYYFLCENIPVKVHFTSNGADLSTLLINYFTTLKYQ